MQYHCAVSVALMLTGTFVVQESALAESDYPAAYFEPYIVYQAPEISAQASEPAEAEAPPEMAAVPETDDRYPAAYFQPTIVFQDQDLIAAKAKEAVAEQEPAAAKKSENGAKKSKPAATEAPTVAPTAAKEKGGVPVGVLFLLVVIAGGLYWVMSRNKADTISEAAPAEADSSVAEAETDDAGSEGESAEQDQTPEVS